MKIVTALVSLLLVELVDLLEIQLILMMKGFLFQRYVYIFKFSKCTFICRLSLME